MSRVNIEIPLLAPAPKGLAIAIERLTDAGYSLTDCSTLELLKQYTAKVNSTPESRKSLLAIVPVTHLLNLEKVAELIRTLRLETPDLQVYAVHAGRLPFKVTDAYRAGMNGLYSLPFEEEIFLNKVFEIAPIQFDTKNITLDQLVRVNIIELEKTKSIEFNIYLYLPVNRRAILYLEKGRPVDEKTLKKFKENKHYALYIRRSDLSDYLAYTNKALTQNPQDEGLTQAERGRKRAERITQFMGGFFSDDSISEDDSKTMLENLKSVLNGIEDESGGKKELVEAVENFSAQTMTHLSHARNVAAYCALFGAALGNLESQTLRMGGLLHDLGLSDLPPSLIGRELEELSEEDVAKYKLHPGGGKYTIEERKMKVPSAVIDMVLYHHERPDGSGYPYGKKAAEIPAVAKICALADEFDKLTSVRPGKRQLSPVEAMRRIAGKDGKPPSPIYDESFHEGIVEVFLASQEKKLQAKSAGALGEVEMSEGSGSRRSPTKATVKIAELLKDQRFMPKGQFVPTSVTEEEIAKKAEWALQDLNNQLDEHWIQRI